MTRNKGSVIDGVILSVVVLAAVIYAYHFDAFTGRLAATEADRTISFAETQAILLVFAGGLVLFSFRRTMEARVESRRRILAEREAKSLAFNDSLTGLPNRRQFDAALTTAAETPPSAECSHILLLMDLNGFKRINDLYGHQAGDEVLIQVGARLNRAVRTGDLVARLGGDEFAILSLNAPGMEAAMSLAMRVMRNLEDPVSAAGTDHRVGIAIGVSLLPENDTVPAELLRKADIALYRAKAETAHTTSAVRFYEGDMDAHMRERDRIERELRRAIDAGEIRPHYQPLVDISDGRVVAFEVLARWASPTLGDVPPSRFIPIAEEADLIRPLSRFLLRQACRDAAAWPSHISIAFNISGALLQNPGFEDRVLAILAETGFEPSRLELEITETALVRDLDAARRTLGALKEHGVKIALDDFGTGYSSLYHLRALRPDKIKIDRSFVDGIESDPESAAIVKGLIGLGLGLGAAVTAEGVETATQQDILRAQGCSQGQGYLFSRAVDAEAAGRLSRGAASPFAKTA